MGDYALEVEGLGKQFRVCGRADYHRFSELLSSLARAPFRNLRRRVRRSGERDEVGRTSAQFHWALRDVDFRVREGEVLGIVGSNGAGKSTLLKVLSRITEPTEGRVRLWGRVGSLLEVGTGFHPELTGRENIFLNGAILGMTRAEIRSRFDEIVAFSEVERFLDMPVKRYSSGMYMRLAFAVAAHLEPEILVIDEVLAVGDAQFQRKCLGKMETFAKSGRTVLFVSHNTGAVQNLCTRALWLERGRLVREGDVSSIVSEYLTRARDQATERIWEDPTAAPGNDAIRIRRVAAAPTDGASRITTSSPVDLVFEVWNRREGARLDASLTVRGPDGSVAFNTRSPHAPGWEGEPYPTGLVRFTCHVPGDLLNDGTYSVTLRLVEDRRRLVHREDEILAFDVENDGSRTAGWHSPLPGPVRPILDWETAILESATPTTS